jgi:hypothetical protein
MLNPSFAALRQTPLDVPIDRAVAREISLVTSRE